HSPVSAFRAHVRRPVGLARANRAAGSRPPLRYGELRQLWRPQRRTLPLMPEGTFQESYLSPRIEKRLFPLKSQTETVPRPVCTGCGTVSVWLGDSIPRLE